MFQSLNYCFKKVTLSFHTKAQTIVFQETTGHLKIQKE